jgi:hypothetical protein
MPQIEIGDSALRFGQNQRAKEDAFFQMKKASVNEVDWIGVS